MRYALLVKISVVVDRCGIAGGNVVDVDSWRDDRYSSMNGRLMVAGSL